MMMISRYARQTVGILCKRPYNAPMDSELIKNKKCFPAISNYAGEHCDTLGMLVRKYSSESSTRVTTRFSNVPRPTGVKLKSLDVGRGLQRCVVVQFPKRKFVQFFVPGQQGQTRPRSRTGKGWWEFREARPIQSLSLSETTKARNKVRGQETTKSIESIGLVDQNKVRNWPKKSPRDQSALIKSKLSKLLEVSGAIKQPKHDLKDDVAFKKTKLCRFLFANWSKKSTGPSQASQRFSGMNRGPPRRTLPVARPSVNGTVMEYLLTTQNQMLG